ncbi:MAG TPA: haloacid dehalogenase type II [Herpetosiphonaceae bacterium]|nr:haloacid dehalogenase type II [Herpetosiphonaceae bacterium]
MASRLYTVGRVESFAHSTQSRYHLLITLDEQEQRSVAYHLLRQLGNEGVRAAKECAMPRVCVFDVIETMLDLQALDPHFQRIFGDAAARQEWFQQLLQSALVATVTNAYTDFGAVGKAALDMIAERRGVELGDDDRQQILGAVRQLPAHPDVQPGLEGLCAARFRLAALTNSTEEVARTQLNHAGLAGYFEQILSVDAVRRFKPAPEVYRMAAERLDVPTAGMRLVAAHAWDVAGALSAGCAAAFVARPGKVLDPLSQRPDVVGADVRAVAEQIVALEADTRD